MKKKKLQCSVPTLLLAGVLCLTLAACGAKQSSDMLASDTDSAASAALPVKAMNAKRVDENPYMAKSDANIHHDGYNTDSTDEVLPLGIYPEINVSYEKKSNVCSSSRRVCVKIPKDYATWDLLGFTDNIYSQC